MEISYLSNIVHVAASEIRSKKVTPGKREI